MPFLRRILRAFNFIRVVLFNHKQVFFAYEDGLKRIQFRGNFLILYVEAPEGRNYENANILFIVVSNVMKHVCYWIFGCEINFCSIKIFSH